jgi:hypothetical protein
MAAPIEEVDPQAGDLSWHNDRLLDRNEIVHWTASNSAGGFGAAGYFRRRLKTGGSNYLQCATSIRNIFKPSLNGF